MTFSSSCHQIPGGSHRRAGSPARLVLAALAVFAVAPGAQAALVTIGFSGVGNYELFDQDDGGRNIGSVELQVTGSFNVDTSGVENPMNPGEYVAVATSPQIDISVLSVTTFGGISAEQEQAVLDFEQLFPLSSTLPFSNSFGDNDIGEANVSSNDLFFYFPSFPGNNTLALLETLSLSLVPDGNFSPGTLTGAMQNLLDAGNPDSILATAVVEYGGPLGPQFLDNFSANVSVNVSVVPLPATAWLFGSGLLALMAGIRRRTGSPA